jgi:hypothetical protein
MTSDTAPAQFVCPISLELMKDPVMSKDGQNFDRHAILEWLNRGNMECPLTRQPLKPSNLIPNNSLKMSIKTWLFENEGCLEHAFFEDDEEERFVGLVSYGADDNSSELRSEEEESQESAVSSAMESNSTVRSHVRDSIDDELSDLLALYNEVLELTNAPLDFPVVVEQTTTTIQSAPEIETTGETLHTTFGTAAIETMGETLNTAVQENARRSRRWRTPLKAFTKNRSKSSSNSD